MKAIAATAMAVVLTAITAGCGGGGGGSSSGGPGGGGGTGLPTSYTLTDLGTFLPKSINASGQIAGNDTGGGRWDHAVITHFTGMTTASTILPNGNVLGVSSAGAIVRSNGSGVDTLTMPADFGSGAATGTASSGVFCGYYLPTGSTAQNAFTFSTSESTLSMPVDEVAALAFDINASGVAVGNMSAAHNSATMWSAAGAPTILPNLGGSNSLAHGINDIGTIVGEADVPSGATHGCCWTSGVIQDLGVLSGDSSSSTLGLNATNFMVGDSSNGTTEKAVIWYQGTIHNLNSLTAGTGWVLNRAVDINDSGVIVGIGTHNGNPAGFLLTPAP